MDADKCYPATKPISGCLPRGRLQGSLAQWATVDEALGSLRSSDIANGTASITLTQLAGQLHWVATKSTMERTRIDMVGAAAPLNESELMRIADALGNDNNRLLPQLLTTEDNYYFSHHQEAVRLPAYRVIANDDQQTRYYIDPISGALLKKVDGAGRGYRWRHEGLHRWDFTSTLRARPLWDFLMLGLMVGVTAVCGTGAFLAYRRYFPARRESK